jgi:hypothetical protein
MSVNLDFGYKGYVAVQDTKGHELYRREIQSNQEIEPWIEANKPSVQGWDVLKSSFVPVRVDNVADFTRDLFSPTFVNHALKIKNVCLRILVSCLAIIWDRITFPIRCVTWPFRMYSYHYNTKPLPVEELIKTSPHFGEAKRDGVVRLVAHGKYTRYVQSLDDFIKNPKLKHVPNTAATTTHEVTQLVALKALPWTETGHSSNDSTENFWMDLDKRQWHSCGATDSKTSGSIYAC